MLLILNFLLLVTCTNEHDEHDEITFWKLKKSSRWWRHRGNEGWNVDFQRIVTLF